MTFTPVIPLSGYAGWTFLKRTMDTQKAALAASPEVARDADYFRSKIGTVDTADELVGDRRLLGVALGAYGLDADINNKAFVKKVLADGTLDTTDLANKLANKQYYAMSSAFGFGDYSVPGTKLSDFADKTIAAWTDQKFEQAVGAQDNNLRLALNAQRELGTLAGKDSSDNTLWYSVLGSAPLRQVFQGALGLPSSFSSIDLDQQVKVLKEKVAQDYGEGGVKAFSDPANVETLVRRFLIRSDAQSSGTGNSSGSIALQLLSGSVGKASDGGGGLLGLG